jgi:hypothetical protein
MHRRNVLLLFGLFLLLLWTTSTLIFAKQWLHHIVASAEVVRESFLI